MPRIKETDKNVKAAKCKNFRLFCLALNSYKNYIFVLINYKTSISGECTDGFVYISSVASAI
jgi:hypothetical protein